MKAKFTGHDTFPLRYGWLYKAVNHLNLKGKFTSTDEEGIRESIVRLGVGKNMVKAIQYWAESSCVINASREQNSYVHHITPQGKRLFGDGISPGADPYLEKIGSIWLLHFWLNFNDKHLTAYRYFFNYANVQHFEKSKFVDDCYSAATQLIQSEVGNISTIKKDIDCFLNTYCKKAKLAKSKTSIKVDEDHFTSPLSELNLLQDNGAGFYVSALAERPELPIEIFAYALLEFYKLETVDSNVTTIDFDSLLTKPCSPGRIFRLSESGLGQKLDELQEFSAGKISWVDSLGLRQVNINQSPENQSDKYLDIYYGQ
ncbi:DUF4007 family protein [Pseudoalteromonas sp. SSM20]|uniref:DUF4007 family protein n=1 Tax=Pseudoalteromonas sp. SSM20 TaxID=3139394 RepID=UPI003BA938D0